MASHHGIPIGLNELMNYCYDLKSKAHIKLLVYSMYVIINKLYT